MTPDTGQPIEFKVRTQFAGTVRTAIPTDMQAHIAQADAFFDTLPDDAALADQRHAYNAMSTHFLGPRPAEVCVDDVTIPAPSAPLAIRIYNPHGASATEPVLLYVHGGGFWFGDLETHDTIVADLAHRTGLTAIAVDYRRTPDHPFPAARDDAYTAARWIRDHLNARIDPAIIVAGDSCGATLAADIARMAVAKPSGEPRIVGQLLIYPVLGFDFETPSYLDNADAPMLTRETMKHCWAAYLPGGLSDPRASEATPNMQPVPENLAPAAILTAAHDPVCDDGRIYAERLGAAGVPTAFRCDANLPHGHLRARHHCAAAKAAFNWCVAAINLLRPSGDHK